MCKNSLYETFGIRKQRFNKKWSKFIIWKKHRPIFWHTSVGASRWRNQCNCCSSLIVMPEQNIASRNSADQPTSRPPKRLSVYLFAVDVVNVIQSDVIGASCCLELTVVGQRSAVNIQPGGARQVVNGVHDWVNGRRSCSQKFSVYPSVLTWCVVYKLVQPLLRTLKI